MMTQGLCHCPRVPGWLRMPPVSTSQYANWETLFLTLISLNQENIHLTTFNRECSRAFDDLPKKYKAVLQKSDHSPDKAERPMENDIQGAQDMTLQV